MTKISNTRPELTPIAIFAMAAGRSSEFLVRRMLDLLPVIPESGRDIYEALEPLGCNDEVLSHIAALEDPEIHPAIGKMIFHRFTKAVKGGRKLPAHRPGKLPAVLRQFVAVCESAGSMSRDDAVAYIAQALGLPLPDVRAAVRDRPGRRKKKPGGVGK